MQILHFQGAVRVLCYIAGKLVAYDEQFRTNSRGEDGLRRTLASGLAWYASAYDGDTALDISVLRGSRLNLRAMPPTLDASREGDQNFT